jgi:hypothetical protein
MASADAEVPAGVEEDHFVVEVQRTSLLMQSCFNHGFGLLFPHDLTMDISN